MRGCGGFLLERSVTANPYKVVLSGNLYRMKKYFYADWSGLPPGWQCPNLKGTMGHWTAWWVWKEFDDMLWPLLSPHLKPFEHLWETLDQHVGLISPTSSSKSNEGVTFGRITFNSSDWFLGICRIKAKAHRRRGGPLLYCFFSCIFSINVKKTNKK